MKMMVAFDIDADIIERYNIGGICAFLLTLSLSSGLSPWITNRFCHELSPQNYLNRDCQYRAVAVLL